MIRTLPMGKNLRSHLLGCNARTSNIGGDFRVILNLRCLPLSFRQSVDREFYGFVGVIKPGEAFDVAY